MGRICSWKMKAGVKNAFKILTGKHAGNRRLGRLTRTVHGE